jgi:hypothetical protein
LLPVLEREKRSVAALLRGPDLLLCDPASSPDKPHGPDDGDGIDQQHPGQRSDINSCLIEGRSHSADHDTYLQHR